MIAGIGLDIIEVDRMKRAIEAHGRRFLDHVFTAEEQAVAPNSLGRFAYYASRWAAKEAVAKALGTGIGAECGWKDVIVRNHRGGRPHVHLVGPAAETAKRLGISRIHLTLSHERSIAGAQAIAEIA